VHFVERQLVIRVRQVVGYSPPGDQGKYMSRMLVDGESVGSKNLVLNHFTLFPGQKTYKGSHPAPYEEVYYILRGKAVLSLGGTDGERYDVGPDTVAYIPCTMEHQLENVGEEPLEMLTMMPLHPEPGVNELYDERKREWGTSFRQTFQKHDQGANKELVKVEGRTSGNDEEDH
jgi:mannose-6-phosphate isomerase-like protein (cupin superfamily)